MKIAYIALKGMPIGGGIEKYTEEVGSRLVQRGHKIKVYCMRHYGTNDGIYKGMEVKTLPSIKHRSLEKITVAWVASISSLINDDFDIVHYHAIGPSIFSFIPKLKGKKVVVQTHGIEWKRAKWGWGMRNILRLCEIPSTMFPDAFVVTSISQQKYFKEKYKVDSVYIPPGVNNPIYREPDLIKKIGLKGKDYILFAARLVPEKGAHYLIQAYNRLKTDLKLVIAGDAKYEDKYKNQLYNLAKGNNNIIFTGFVQGQLKEELFSNAYLFVSPSEIEGLSVSLLEAMSYGNCCLVSDIPENLEAINEFGFSFRNKEIDDLCAKLDSLISGNNGTHFRKDLVMDYTLKNFSWDIITDKWEQLYLSLLK